MYATSANISTNNIYLIHSTIMNISFISREPGKTDGLPLRQSASRRDWITELRVFDGEIIINDADTYTIWVQNRVYFCMWATGHRAEL